jgi:hypothetical protein
MYGLRRVCLPVTGFLLSASTIHLLNLPSETSGRHLSQAMHDLQAMSTNHHFAGRCVDIIRSLATKWKIALPEDAPSVSPRRTNRRTTGTNSPKSAFYSASIPRQNSSQSGSRSADSHDSHAASKPVKHESPFAPPNLSSHPHDANSSSNSGYYSEQFPSMDQMSMQQQSYWLPFPVQSMPNAHLADMQSSNMQTHSLSYLDSSAEQQWQTHTPTLQQHLANQFQSRGQQQQQTTVGGRVDESMGGSYDNWHWQ